MVDSVPESMQELVAEEYAKRLSLILGFDSLVDKEEWQRHEENSIILHECSISREGLDIELDAICKMVLGRGGSMEVVAKQVIFGEIFVDGGLSRGIVRELTRIADNLMYSKPLEPEAKKILIENLWNLYASQEEVDPEAYQILMKNRKELLLK